MYGENGMFFNFFVSPWCQNLLAEASGEKFGLVLCQYRKQGYLNRAD